MTIRPSGFPSTEMSKNTVVLAMTVLAYRSPCCIKGKANLDIQRNDRPTTAN